MFSGRRQPSCDDTSRMTREFQVRICERLGVKFPGPTRQSRVRRSQQSTHRAQYRRRVSPALERVRQVAVRTQGGSRMREIGSSGSNGMDRPRSIGASVEEERIVNTCSTSHGGTFGSRMIVARRAPSPSSPRLRLAAARLRA